MRLLFLSLVGVMDKRMAPFLDYLTPPPVHGNYVISLEENSEGWLRKVETYADSF